MKRESTEAVLDAPVQYERVRLAEVADVIRGVTYKKQDASEKPGEGLIPILRANNIQDGVLEVRGDLVHVPRKLVSETQVLRKGDVVIATSSGSKDLVGKAAPMREDWIGSFGAFCAVVRPRKAIHPLYLVHFLGSPEYKDLIRKKALGVNINNLRRGDLEELMIPLAPLPEQRRIVEAIELQLGRLDAAVARLHAAKAKLKRYRQAVLKAAVEGRLLYPEIEEGELPRGWKVVPVEAVGQIVTGNTPSKSVAAYYGDEHPFYKPTDLEAGYDTTESTDGLTAAGLAEARALPAKSILVTCIGATIGKTGFIRTPGACNQQVNAIVPNQQLMPEYGYFHCISPYFQKQIKDNASSTTLPLLNKSRFKVLDFILPTKSDQLRIVKEVEARLSAVYETDATLDAQLLQATRLRQAVLKRAFEGRLVEDTVNRNVSKG